MRTNLHPSDCLGFRSCVSFRPVSAHLAASCSRAHAAALYRYKEARSRAHDFASRRGIYFRAAVEAFVSGNASYAGELARKGKDENKAMHKAHMQAMLSIFQAQYVPPLSEHASLNAYSLAGTPSWTTVASWTCTGCTSRRRCLSSDLCSSGFARKAVSVLCCFVFSC